MVQQKLVSSEKPNKDDGMYHVGKIPELRFPEFDEDWEEKGLGDILTRRKKVQKISKDAPLLAFASGQGVIPRSERKTNNRDFLTKDSENKNYLLTEYDDIVYNPSNLKYGAIDRNSYGRGVISPIYVTFVSNISPLFMEYIVKSYNFKQKALKYEEGTVIKRQSVHPEDLVKIKINIPKTEAERIKIGTFLSLIDKKIELLEKKNRHYHEIKNYLMQEIFTQELRFPDYDDEWDWLNFEDIFKSVSTKKYQIKSAEINTNGLYEVIDQGQQEIAGFHNDDSRLFYELPIIIYGDHTTLVKYRNEPFIVGADGVKLLSSKIDVDMKYMYYALNYFNIKPEGYKRHFSIIKKIDLPIPTMSEQKDISNFFSNFDKKIKYLQVQFETMKDFKKGLLQKMFV